MLVRAARVLCTGFASSILMLACCLPAAAADGTIALQATVPSASPQDYVYSLIDLAKALAWPLVVAFLAYSFRTPLAGFANAIGGRVNKLQIAQLSIELASAREPPGTPLLNEIRDPARSAHVGDSSQSLLEQARSTDPADFAVIRLGEGEEWLTSRLFIAAVMMERMRGIKVFVFVESTRDSQRHFLAIVDVRRLRWILARRYPWLEVAYVLAESHLYQLEQPKFTNTQNVTTENGALAPNIAQQVVQSFIRELQEPAPSPNNEWVTLEGGMAERATWITRRLLDELLPLSDFDTSVIETNEMSAMSLSRAVLRRKGQFVAVVDSRNQFSRLVDRRALLEVLATQGSEHLDA